MEPRHRYRNDTGIFVDGPHFITFSLQTCDKAVLALVVNISVQSRIEDWIIWEVAIERRQNRPHVVSLRPCHCVSRQRIYNIQSNDCNKQEDYWLAWSKVALRLGLGRYPGENEVQALILHHEIRPVNLHVVVAEGGDITANWTLYRHTNFTS